MNKKLITLALAVCLVFTLALPTFAAAGGFKESGGWTVTDTRYSFDVDKAVLEYNKDIRSEEDNWVDYTEIYSGSNLYVPIIVDHNDWDEERHATMKQIKDDNVEAVYVDIVGGRYINSVSIVDGKKEKDAGLSSGAYLKVSFVDNYSAGSRAHIEIKILLSVNKVSHQESRVVLECDISNRMEHINDNSVYGAQVPTTFKVDDFYDGRATFDLGGGAKYSTSVTRRQKYTIDLDRSVDYDIDLLYPDAYLQFYNFRGDSDTFAAVGKLELPIDTKSFKDDSGQPRVYAYEVLNGNQLKALGSDVASYDSKNQILTINTKTLGYYVLSNQKLAQTVSVEDDDTFQSGYAEAAAESSAVDGIEDAVQRGDTGTATVTPTQITSEATVINAANPNGGENPPTSSVVLVAPAMLAAALSAAAAWALKPQKV